MFRLPIFLFLGPLMFLTFLKIYFFVGQLAELGYRIIFDYSVCIVQDPRTGQEFGTGPRVGRMFLVDNLCLPLIAPISVAAATTVSSIPSLALWHA